MTGQLLRACARCGAPFKPRDARHRHCALHEQHGNEHRSPTTRTRPTSSRERERIRAKVLARDPLCQLQLPGCTLNSDVVDHIVPAAEGGRYEASNLRGACDHCNATRGGKQAHQPVSRDRSAASPSGRGGGAGATRLS